MLDSNRTARAPCQILRQTLVPRVLSLYLEVVELLVRALPALAEDRKPRPWRRKEPLVVVQPDGLWLKGEPCDRKFRHVHLLPVILKRRLVQSLQSCFACRKKLHWPFRLQQSRNEDRRLGCWPVIADVEAVCFIRSVFRRAFPMSISVFTRKMLIHWRFQVVIPRDVGARWHTAGADQVVRRYLWAPPAIIKLKRAVDPDRKSTRLNSSHQIISYAVFCLKKKKQNTQNSNASTHLLSDWLQDPCQLT